MRYRACTHLSTFSQTFDIILQKAPQTSALRNVKDRFILKEFLIPCCDLSSIQQYRETLQSLPELHWHHRSCRRSWSFGLHRWHAGVSEEGEEEGLVWPDQKQTHTCLVRVDESKPGLNPKPSRRLELQTLVLLGIGLVLVLRLSTKTGDLYQVQLLPWSEAFELHETESNH